MATAPAPSGEPRLLSLGELESRRDLLAGRAAARATESERTARQEGHRVLIEGCSSIPPRTAEPW